MPDLIQLYLFLAALLLIFGSYKDMGSFDIPYITIIGVGTLGVLCLYAQNKIVYKSIALALVAGVILLTVSKVYSVCKEKPVLGYGDIQLFMACILWIDIDRLSSFLIVTGIAGVVHSYVRSTQGYFPLVPSITTGWFVTIALLR